ncbi:MAG: adenylate/guanylate cyclase domain-containing protein [Kofleriaceae bacterium]
MALSVVDRILADPSLARSAASARELTVLFSDIRGFSRFAEAMPPEELAALLNEYLTPMTELVLAEGGMLDKLSATP